MECENHITIIDSIQPNPKSFSQGNLICNFRAPSLKEYSEWQKYKAYIKNQGLDICRVTIGLTNAFMAGIEGAEQVNGKEQNVSITMNNQFLYQVQKPRREPYSLNCVKSEFRRTFSSILFEAYVLDKAKEINREFSYRDFLELDQGAFHRIVRRLKRKGKLMANPQRTVPRFYILAERLADYPSVSETNTVKQLFTNRGSAEVVLGIVRECISEEEFMALQWKRLREESTVKVMEPIRVQELV
jgi:uncharacterized protein YceH (UPF0502 family)